MKAQRILFVCVENSCRSQMAEGLARMEAGDAVEVYSSGSRPSGQVNPGAVAVMAELGYDLKRHTSKGLEGLPQGEFDVVVTMSCGDSCPLVHAKQRFDWAIPDPKQMNTEQLRAVRDLIADNVHRLLKDVQSNENGR